MIYDQFVGQVQHRGKLASREASVTSIRATLETLAERLTGNETDDLAAQLPREIGEYLRIARRDSPERFSLQDFFVRVAAKENVDVPDAAYHARAVVEVLQGAVSAGEMEDVMAQLPAEFDRLFEAGSTGSMTPHA